MHADTSVENTTIMNKRAINYTAIPDYRWSHKHQPTRRRDVWYVWAYIRIVSFTL